MSTQNENMLVKLIKKSVGLPTGKSSCCDTPTGLSSNCCGSEEGSDCCGAESSQSLGCNCGSEGCGGNCCGAEEDKGSGSSPAVGTSSPTA